MKSAREKILDYLVDGIMDGRIPAGARIPTEVELAGLFHTNRMNAHFAIKEMERHNLVARNKKQGSFARRKPSAALARRIKNTLVKRIHIISSELTRDKMHWDNSTLRELESLLRENDFDVVHRKFPQNVTVKKFEGLLSDIAGSGSSGLLLMPDCGEFNFYMENARSLFTYHSNIFLYDFGSKSTEGWPFHKMQKNPFFDGVMAAEYLHGNGLRDIAYVKFTESPHFWDAERSKGLVWGLGRESGGSGSAELWDFPHSGDSSGVWKDVIASGKYYALVASNDECAARLVDDAKKAGFSAPKDFSVISFDDNPAYRDYNLTTIAVPLGKIASNLCSLITGGLAVPDGSTSIHMRISAEITERLTCKTVK